MPEKCRDLSFLVTNDPHLSLTSPSYSWMNIGGETVVGHMGAQPHTYAKTKQAHIPLRKPTRLRLALRAILFRFLVRTRKPHSRLRPVENPTASLLRLFPKGQHGTVSMPSIGAGYGYYTTEQGLAGIAKQKEKQVAYLSRVGESTNTSRFPLFFVFTCWCGGAVSPNFHEELHHQLFSDLAFGARIQHVKCPVKIHVSTTCLVNIYKVFCITQTKTDSHRPESFRSREVFFQINHQPPPREDPDDWFAILILSDAWPNTPTIVLEWTRRLPWFRGQFLQYNDWIRRLNKMPVHCREKNSQWQL